MPTYSLDGVDYYQDRLVTQLVTYIPMVFNFIFLMRLGFCKSSNNKLELMVWKPG